MISGDRSILQRKQGAFWYTLQELRKHWDRIDVICPRIPRPKNDNGDSPSEVFPNGTVVFHPCPWGLFWQSLWIARKGRELLEEHHHDVMTVHEYPPFYNGVGAARIARTLRLPYALEIHHLVGYPHPATPSEWIGRMLSRLYLPHDAKRARAVRVVNETTGEQLVRWGIPREKIHVVSSFYLDPTVLRGKIRPPVIYDVAFCARLVPNKGLKNLIRAIAKIPQARLLVIGDGPQRLKCEKLAAALGIENRTAFLGWLPTFEAVISAIGTARMFVVNSLSEGGPRTGLEAMAYGMPVITTRVGVMPEVVQDGVNGLFTDGTPDDLERKIRTLLADEALCDRMGKAATSVLDRFERTKLIAEYAEFLQSLVQPSSPPA